MDVLIRSKANWLSPSYISVFIISFFIAFIFYKHQAPLLDTVTQASDAAGYAQMAKNITPALKGGIRTYAYPLFLKLTAPVTGLKVIGFMTMLVQYLLYGLSVLLFSFAVSKIANIRLLITAALMLNLYVLAYLSITLSETLSFACLLLTMAAFFGLNDSRLRHLLLGLGAAFAVEVRPANVWFFALTALLLCFEQHDKKASWKETIKSALFFLSGAIIAFLPQVYFNVIFFHKLTPLPANGLALSQYRWGKQITMVSFSLLPEAFYANVVQNPFSMVTPQNKFNWFSFDGFSYGLFKIFAMFTHSGLFVYQTLSIKYQKIMLIFSSFTVYFGFLGLIFQKQNMAFFKLRAAWLGIFLCVLCSIFTALEDRFTFPLYMLLLPFALYQAWEFIQNKKYVFFGIFPLFFLVMNMFNSMFEALSPMYIDAIHKGLVR